MAEPVGIDRGERGSAPFAWLSLLFGAWIFGGLIFWIRAFETGLTIDVVISPYHIPFYSGILGLGALTAGRAVRARRAGRAWQRAFPNGYGTLGVGAFALLAWPFVHVAWRDGIGFRDESLEQFIGPSELLLITGICLVAVSPLRAALRSGPAPQRWPVALSTALAFAVLGGYGGFAPPNNLWLTAPETGREDDSEIWVMNADGSMQTRLIEAADGFTVANAVWSPDGRQIAYTRSKRPDRYVLADDLDIWLASADGSNQRPLVEGPGWQWVPHWSPDGNWIVYTIDPAGGPGGGAGLTAPAFAWGQGPAAGEQARVAPPVDVWRVRADGTGQREQLTSGPSDDRAGVYAPDGRHLLFDSTRADGRPGIYVMSADGSNVVQVTSMGDDWGGAWSPDGEWIAFNSSPTGGGEDIYVTRWPVAGPPIQLTDDPEAEVVPSWSPDGSRIAFLTRQDGPTEIWSMAAGGGDWRNLSRTPGDAESLPPGGGAWGPDGRIVFSRENNRPAWASGLVREDLAVAGALLQAVLLAALVLAAVRAGGAPFGSVAVILGAYTFVAVIGNGEWRFLPAAVILGLLVDVLARLAPPRLKAPAFGAGSASALIIAPSLTILATTVLEWSPTLTLGVVMAAAALGWGLSGLIVPRAAMQAVVANE